jgi:hypothetical protein
MGTMRSRAGSYLVAPRALPGLNRTLIHSAFVPWWRGSYLVARNGVVPRTLVALSK